MHGRGSAADSRPRTRIGAMGAEAARLSRLPGCLARPWVPGAGRHGTGHQDRDRSFSRPPTRRWARCRFPGSIARRRPGPVWTSTSLAAPFAAHDRSANTVEGCRSALPGTGRHRLIMAGTGHVEVNAASRQGPWEATTLSLSVPLSARFPAEWHSRPTTNHAPWLPARHRDQATPLPFQSLQ